MKGIEQKSNCHGKTSIRDQHYLHALLFRIVKKMQQVSAVSTVKSGWGNNDFHNCKTLVDILVTVKIESKLSGLYATIISTVILDSIQTAVRALPW